MLRSRLANTEVNFRPETEPRLQELASKSGRPPSDLIEDTMAGYLQEVTQVREILDGRYDNLKNGRVQPVEVNRPSPISGKRASQPFFASEPELVVAPGDTWSSLALSLTRSLCSTCRNFRKCMYKSVREMFLQEH